jgi:hypothetical protein
MAFDTVNERRAMAMGFMNPMMLLPEAQGSFTDAMAPMMIYLYPVSLEAVEPPVAGGETGGVQIMHMRQHGVRVIP